MDLLGNLLANAWVVLEKVAHVVLPFLSILYGAFAVIPVVELCDVGNVHRGTLLLVRAAALQAKGGAMAAQGSR
eukprot:761971-Hanusia_phi.AAC.1